MQPGLLTMSHKALFDESLPHFPHIPAHWSSPHARGIRLSSQPRNLKRSFLRHLSGRLFLNTELLTQIPPRLRAYDNVLCLLTLTGVGFCHLQSEESKGLKQQCFWKYILFFLSPLRPQAQLYLLMFSRLYSLIGLLICFEIRVNVHLACYHRRKKQIKGREWMNEWDEFKKRWAHGGCDKSVFRDVDGKMVSLERVFKYCTCACFMWLQQYVNIWI